MKKGLIYLSLLILPCYTFPQQGSTFIDRIKKNFIGMYDQSQYVFCGEGYRITAGEYLRPQNLFFDGSYIDKVTFESNLLRGYNIQYRGKDNTLKDLIIAVPNNKTDTLCGKQTTVYFVKIDGGNKILKIEFDKYTEIDTVFQKQFVEAFYYKTIPLADILIRKSDSVVNMFGKVIPLNSFKIKSTGILADEQNNSIQYQYYGSIEDAIKDKNKNLACWFSYSEKNILYEGRDTIIVEGKYIVADRISYQIEQFYFPLDVQQIVNIYFFANENNGIPYFMCVKYITNVFKNDSTNLPPSFIQDNIMQLKNEPELLHDKIRFIPISHIDTAYIHKKIRLPIWTYYDKNTNICGVSLGAGAGGGNVTTNGVKLSIPGPGIFSIFMNAQPNPDNEIDFKIKQKTLEFFENKKEKINGINIGGTGDFLENGFVNGLNINVVGSYYVKTNGITVAGFHNCLDINNGLQAVFGFNWVYISRGVQLALIMNTAAQVRGLQIGAMNEATEKSKGVQLGIVNKAKECSGIQIGLWNRIGKRGFPLVNFSFKKKRDPLQEVGD